MALEVLMTEKDNNRVKRWYAANREKRLAKSREYYAKNKNKILAAQRINRATNPETHRKRGNEASRRWRTKNRNKWLASHRSRYWRSTGRPAPTRPEPINCECCGNPRGKKALCLDHDHAAGVFRGWICFSYNTGIGKPGDSIEGVQRALNYLTHSVDGRVTPN